MNIVVDAEHIGERVGRPTYSNKNITALPRVCISRSNQYCLTNYKKVERTMK